jgi:hypothetical protein
MAMSLFRRIADNRVDTSLASRLRRRRFRLFEEIAARFPRPVRVLDIGGTASYWRSMGVTADSEYQIVLVNRTLAAVTEPFLETQVGDARDLSRFESRAFDLVFSNSVIEHVGDIEAQRRMAGEVMRLGRSYYVQTPNRRFPIEPHFLLPYFGFWPRDLRIALVQRFALGWYPRLPDRDEARELVDSHHLLDERDMRALFPGATLHRECVLGLTKSLIACGTTD